MNIDKGIDDSRPMHRRHGEPSVSDGEWCWGVVCRKVKVESMRELHADLIEGLIGPVTKPVEDATIEQGRRGGSSWSQPILRGIHRENDMEILGNLLGEPPV